MLSFDTEETVAQLGKFVVRKTTRSEMGLGDGTTLSQSEADEAGVCRFWVTDDFSGDVIAEGTYDGEMASYRWTRPLKSFLDEHSLSMLLDRFEPVSHATEEVPRPYPWPSTLK